MKNQPIKLLSISALVALFTITSCNNSAKETAITKNPIEVKKEDTKKVKPEKVETPQPSPLSKVTQKVGLTDVTIEYSRPGVKERTIFGDLVPYGKTWRTGANENTKITFSTDATVGNTNVAAGTYAIYTIPNKDNWDIILYSDIKNWGTPREWDDAKVIAKTTASVTKMPMDVETFTITFDDIKNNAANIGFIWENVYVAVPFTVPTDKAVLASIEKVMAGTPNHRAYFDAAVYYNNENKDIKQAVTWIDKAIELTKEKPKFWYLRQQALIHAKAGLTTSAISAATKSLELAEKAGNNSYVKMNKASLKEWGAK